jgi:5-methylcytosine-specific restriction endonuclease McrA
MHEPGAIRFAEKLLALLNEGQFTATYKFAVLLAMLDLVLENADRAGEPPDVLTTLQLADKVIELYWPHTTPFAHAGGAAVLLQNSGTQGAQAEIIRRIQDFRALATRRFATGSLVQLRERLPDEFAALQLQVEWKLIQMPLPRLQVVGNVRDTFVYEIGWDTNVTRAHVAAYQKGEPGRFDNRISLRPGVGSYLLQLNTLLRPLIHRQWVAMVARLNRLEEAQLENFLFGSHRIGLELVRPALVDLQNGLCFFCRRTMRGNIDVDHFIPWSRYPENGLANLVVAHDACNRAKSDFLPATTHVIRWSERLHRAELVQLAAELKWHAAIADMRGVARAVYLRLPEDALLWAGGNVFENPDFRPLQTALAS